MKTRPPIDYYKLLLAELEERIANKEAAVEDERFRIYWDGMPVWGRLSVHAKLFSELRTNVLASTYCKIIYHDAKTCPRKSSESDANWHRRNRRVVFISCNKGDDKENCLRKRKAD